MSKPFSVNTNRFDPYKSYRFLVYFGTPRAVAGVSKVTAIKRSSDVIEYKEGGNAIILKGLGRTKYEPITLERGVTYDTDFQNWADAPGARQGLARHIAEEPAPRDPHRIAQRRGSTGPPYRSIVAGFRNIRPCPI